MIGRKVVSILVLTLLLCLSLVGCGPWKPVEDQVSEQPVHSPSPSQVQGGEEPGQQTNQGGDVETKQPEDIDPEDPENVTVGDREATLTMVVEGIAETIPAVRHTSWMGYAMTYDPQRFTMAEDGSSDIYLAEVVEGRPNVYISVSVVDGLTAEEAVEGLREQNNIDAQGEIVAFGANRYAATYLRRTTGAGSNDAVVEFYVTEQNGTIFLVEVGYFVDGVEGFGARLAAMLDTITF